MSSLIICIQILCGCSILGSCHRLQCIKCGHRICGNDDREVTSRRQVSKCQVFDACNRCVARSVWCATSVKTSVGSVVMMFVIVITRGSRSGFQAVKTCGTLCSDFCKYFCLKRQYSIEINWKPFGILLTSNHSS